MLSFHLFFSPPPSQPFMEGAVTHYEIFEVYVIPFIILLIALAIVAGIFWPQTTFCDKVCLQKVHNASCICPQDKIGSKTTGDKNGTDKRPDIGLPG